MTIRKFTADPVVWTPKAEPFTAVHLVLSWAGEDYPIVCQILRDIRVGEPLPDYFLLSIGLKIPVEQESVRAEVATAHTKIIDHPKSNLGTIEMTLALHVYGAVPRGYVEFIGGQW